MWFPARHHQFTATEHAVKGRQLWFLMHFSNRSEQRISSGPADMNIFPRLSLTLSSIYFDSNVCDSCRVFLSVVCFNGCFIIIFFYSTQRRKDIKYQMQMVDNIRVLKKWRLSLAYRMVSLSGVDMTGWANQHQIRSDWLIDFYFLMNLGFSYLLFNVLESERNTALL